MIQKGLAITSQSFFDRNILISGRADRFAPPAWVQSVVRQEGNRHLHDRFGNHQHAQQGIVSHPENDGGIEQLRKKDAIGHPAKEAVIDLIRIAQDQEQDVNPQNNQEKVAERPQISGGTLLPQSLPGIAETGTLVIPSGESQPLTASLLSEIHIAVLSASDIEENLERIMELRKIETYPAVVLVSGPSSIADMR